MIVEETHATAHRPERTLVIDRWRRHYERDRRAFERIHGRPAATHYELAEWLAHAH